MSIPGCDIQTKTLTPDDMQAQGYIQSVGYDVKQFWEETNTMAHEHGMDSNLAYMYKMVQENLVGEYNHVAALGMIFTILTIPIVIIGRKFMNRFGEEVEY